MTKQAVRRKGNKVVIYLRISKNRDDQQSIENQERECREYCARKGWEVVAVKIDVGLSGYKNVKRPGFDAAMMMIQTHQADMLVTFKISRFIRNISEFHRSLDAIIQYGGGFDSVKDDVDYMSVGGKIILAILAGLAELESENKADFARSWHDGRTAKGAVPSGNRPFGYNRIDKEEAPVKDGLPVTLQINDGEALLIKNAAAAILGGKSLRFAMQPFDGVIGTRGEPLTLRGLKMILTSPTTAGLRAIKDEDGNLVRYQEGCWDAILTRAEFDALNEILFAPERLTATNGTAIKHLLSGVMLCGRKGCEGVVSAREQRRAPTKKNPNPTKERRYYCRECHNSANADIMDNAVRARLMTLVDQDAWQRLREQGRGYDPAVIADIESEQLKLEALFNADRIKVDQFTRMNDVLLTRLAQATGTEALDLPAIENLESEWDALPVKDKRRVLRVVFGEIKLNTAQETSDPTDRLETHRAI